MADRTMEELLRAPTEGYGEAIVLPEINADHFEIKTNLLQLVQANPFHGLDTQHRSVFSETVPFPRRLQNLGCVDWREAQDVKILDAYDHTLPQKEKDSGSFTLPCFIHNIYFEKALVDLGASVRVMPISTYTNLGLGILTHTRISFDESDDEDYTVIYDENSFSYKIISVNDLKTDSKNDNKVNMPSFPSPEPEVGYSNDLDFFKDFENEFPAIVYNDALTSKLDLLTEPTISPRHIDEFDMKDETSLSECDEEEQNVLYFNDLFPFNVIYPDDLKSDTDNNNKIDIEQPSGDMSVILSPNITNVDTQGSNKLLATSHDTSN
ncbi:hypothetical protein Tco_1048060 [Tanacetum coccineum]